MSQDIYAKPDFNKKVRYQTGENRDGNADISDNTDDVVTIYDNYMAEESTRAKLEENTTEHRQQAVPVTVNSGKRKLLKVAALFLGLLCLCLLTAIIILLVLLFQDKNSWNTERRELISERKELLNSNAEIKVLLSQTTSQLKEAEAAYDNFTKERKELKKQLDGYFQRGWVYFNHSLYFLSFDKKQWQESRDYCLQEGADLLIIDSKEEQNFAARFLDEIWIGLKYNESTSKWNWLDGTPLTTSYWGEGEPNGVDDGEHCVELKGEDKKWNDIQCTKTRTWTCEKKIPL